MNDIELTRMRSQINKQIFFFTALKIAISTAVIWSWDFGIYLVVAYLIYSLERSKFYQFLNASETNVQLNKMEHSKQLEYENLNARFLALEKSLKQSTNAKVSHDE